MARTCARFVGQTLFTPLHAAVASGHAEVVRLLLEAGADAGARNKRGKTPRQLAKKLKALALLSLFRQHQGAGAAEDKEGAAPGACAPTLLLDLA